MDIKDETGTLAVRALTGEAVDKENSRRVLRKVDGRILPFLCITFGLQVIDKMSLNYASIYGLIEDNNLQGQDFSWATSIFFFGYLVAEYPGLALLQKFPIAKFLGINQTIWGAIMMSQAACSSFASLAAVRFILGMAESTFAPGFVAMMVIWWTREEQAARSALWVSFLGVGSVVGTLFAYAVGHIQGSLSIWKYMFIILGTITIVWGVVFAYFVPDNPANVHWLDEDEKVIAVQRVISNKTGTKSRQFVKAQVFEAVTDPKVILMGLISFSNAFAMGWATFGSLIIHGFGFSPLQTILMTLPCCMVQLVTGLSAGLGTFYIRNSRLYIGSIAMIPPIIGTILINNLGEEDKWGRLVGFWLFGSQLVGLVILFGILSTNIAGTTKRSIASGWVFICYCIGQIAGPQCFKNTEAPTYRTGIVSLLSGFILNLVLNLVLRMLYVLENEKRDRAMKGKSEEEIAEMRRESDIQGFEDVTDKHNAMFRYAL